MSIILGSITVALIIILISVFSCFAISGQCSREEELELNNGRK